MSNFLNTSRRCGITFEDFRGMAGRLAGSNATGCDHADVNQGGEQDTCIGNAYLSRGAAFSNCEAQGIDSRPANALAIMANNRVYRWSSDSDPTGGGSLTNGDILIAECLNARLSGVFDGQSSAVFVCDWMKD